MLTRLVRVSAALCVIAGAACDRPAGPDGSQKQHSTNGGTDTSGTGGVVDPPNTHVPTDTGSHYNGLVTLTVEVMGATRSSSNGADTLNLAPIANARVEVEGILELAQSAQAGTTDANGKFVVSELPVGPYRVKITPPAGSGFSAQVGQNVLNAENVSMRFTLFKQ